MFAKLDDRSGLFLYINNFQPSKNPSDFYNIHIKFKEV